MSINHFLLVIVIVFNSSDYRAFEEKKTAVSKKEFLDRTHPAFGVATSALYTVTIGLDYYGSNVDINGRIHPNPEHIHW